MAGYGQELEPRDLINLPIGINFFSAGYAYASGNTLLDPSLPLEDFEYTFEGVKSDENIFQVRLALPYFYTWVIHENWFIGGNLSPSLGVSFSRYKEDLADMRMEKEHLSYP